MNRFHLWFCRSSFWRKMLTREVIPWALAGVELGDDVLEVGPGPGLTTDILRQRYQRITALEIDHLLADSLKQRLRDTNVSVFEGDATKMPFEDSAFSGAVSFTMLHHVPSPDLQDRLLAEAYRVLKPGGIFAGIDSRWSIGFQLIHLADMMVVVDPDTFGSRLEAAGFKDVSVETVKRAFRFRARRPSG
jgi:SAM-dependent methyltransferase